MSVDGTTYVGGIWMYVWCIVPMALEELNAKNNNG